MARVLICYLGHNSGHHSAARALDAALRQLDASVETMLIDLFAYTAPRASVLLDKLYMVTIRRTPEVWESLYDSAWLEQTTRRWRHLVQSGDSDELHKLMQGFRPDAAVCTQAHPLAVLSSYAVRRQVGIPLWGVVTDYVPHRFWVANGEAQYVVATEMAARRLMLLGVPRSRIHVFGIPIDPRFAAARSAECAARGGGCPRILVMGGSRGLGVRYRTIKSLDMSPLDFSVDIVTGMNRRLRARLLRHREDYRHRVRVRGYVRDIFSLLQRACLLISKPGGLTSAEAAAMGLPMVIVRPLPGQEQNNANVLVEQGCAISVERDKDVGAVVTALLSNEAILSMMHERALRIGKPDASLLIAQAVLGDICARRARVS
jgi:processive 1,2-diacylglycerol beta-glucosyltransferase